MKSLTHGSGLGSRLERLYPTSRGASYPGCCWHLSSGQALLLPRPPQCATLPSMANLPHADVVGSLIRPPELLAAREDIAARRNTPSEFKRIEDAAVDSAVAAQEAAGLEGSHRRRDAAVIVSEPDARGGRRLRRSSILTRFSGATGGAMSGPETHARERPATLGVVGKLRRKRHLSAEEVYLSPQSHNAHTQGDPAKSQPVC